MGDHPSAAALPESSDADASQFRAGSAGDGILVATTSEGTEVLLAPAIAVEFRGDELPGDWFVEAWKEGGTAELGAEAIRLEGTRVGHAGLFGSNRSLEFVATFSGRPHQHVGFGTNFKDVPWVSFGNKFGHSLYARSNFFVAEDTRLSPSLLGGRHRFRIEWNIIDIKFWVDGRRVAHQLVPIVGYMRPMASNGSMGGGALAIEWMRMSPYRPSGTFTSRVHDAGTAAVWVGCDVDASVPSKTAVSIELRAGDVTEPDGTWSGWAPAGSGDADGAARGRFAQYRAVLTTDDPSSSPVLRRVTLRYSTADGAGPGSSSSGSF